MPVPQTIEDRINQMKQTQTIWLPGMDLFWHFVVVGILLVLPVLKTYTIITDRFFSESFNRLFWGGYFWVIPAVYVYFLQKKRLKFTIIDRRVDQESFKTVVTQTAEQMQWSYQFVTDELVVAKAAPNWKSWGHHITILHTPHAILFNSISEPNRITLTSWGKNHENLKTFEYFVNNDKAGLL